MKIPIDKIPVEMYRTVHKKDANGNRIREKEKYIGYKKLRLVGGWLRFGHFFIDYICFQIISQIFVFFIQVIAIAASLDPLATLTIGLGASMIALTIYPLFYFLFELKFQRTPGKWITKTIVVDLYGEKPHGSNILGRSVIRIIPFEALSCLSDSNRGWHDKWSDTFVMTKKEYDEIKTILTNLNAENKLS